MQIEHKAASAAGVAGGVVDSADPYTHWIIASVTGVKDEVNDVIEPGAYKATLAERKPKVIKDHDWTVRLGRAVEVKELLPGDPGLPATTSQGKPWPREAGALMAKVRLFKGTPPGDEAAVRWTDEGAEQQFSIGYAVPKGKSTTRNGIRYIHELKCFEISDVLWGAMPLGGIMPAPLATKMLTGGPAADGVAGEVPGLTAPGQDLDADQVAQLDTDIDGDVDADLAEIDGKTLTAGTAEGSKWTRRGDKWPATTSTGVTVTLGPGVLPATTGGTVEVKYDTSPVGSEGDRENWVDKVGGLPPFVRAIAHALIRQGRSEQQAIQMAIGTVRRWARGGGKVSEKTRAKAAEALAEWEKKKAAARADTGKKDLAEAAAAVEAAEAEPAAPAAPAEVDLGGWDPTLEVGEHAAHAGDPVEVKSAARLPGSLEERMDALRDAVTRTLRGPLRPVTDAGDQAPAGGHRYDWNHVSIDGTWADHVVATRVRWDGPTGDETESFQIPYQWGPDGTVMLGDPDPVELTLAIEPLDPADAALTEDSGYKALTLDAVAPAVQVLTDAATMAARALHTRSTGTDVGETKAGRVLSGRNQQRLQDALQGLLDVLAAAGVHLGKDDPDEAASEPPSAAESKQAPGGEIGPIYGLGDLPDPRAFAAELRAAAVDVG